jgi:hypothetical protein
VPQTHENKKKTATYGFAHVEFASTEEAIRAARQGVPHGFRYANRLLDVDFAPWLFHIGPTYRVVYISGWSTSKGRSALLQWASDIPNVISATIRTCAHSSLLKKNKNLTTSRAKQWHLSAANSVQTRAARSYNSGP